MAGWEVFLPGMRAVRSGVCEILLAQAEPRDELYPGASLREEPQRQ
jgi:hypothetical protein